jgi:hypothetical protein
MRIWVALALCFACAAAGADRKAPAAAKKRMPMSTPCDRTITPAEAAELNDLLTELPDGAVVCFAEGRYELNLLLKRSVTLRGSGPGVVLDGKGLLPVVLIDAQKGNVVVENLTLRRGGGGPMGEGGCLSVARAAKVIVRDCVLERGEADANGGGALAARRGELVVERCKLTRSRGARASTLLLDGVVRASVVDSRLVDNDEGAPAILVNDHAELELVRSVVARSGGVAIEVHAPPDHAAKATLVDSIVAGAVRRDGAGQVKITARGSALVEKSDAVEDAGGNVYGAVELDDEGRVKAGSPAAGRGPRM